MKKSIFWSLMMLLAVSVSFVSCSSDDDPVIVKNGSLTLEMPINVSDVVLNSFEGTATNVQTGRVTTLPMPVKTGDDYVITIPELEAGAYNIAAKGNISFLKDGVAGKTDFEVVSNGVSLSETVNALKLAVNSFQAEGGFVISEIFFTGTTTPEGNQYSGGDAYIVISNNSDVTLYADSIAVLESEFLTTTKRDYTPDVMNEAFSTDAVYMIPGNGKSVAVEPGKSLVLAINAINHKEANPNSIDLTGADFEFFDESSNPRFTDPDGPATNLDKWYCYTATVYGFHNRGFRSMAIARMQTSKENWLENYAYTAAYTWTFNEYSFDRTVDTYKVPNAWILDAVNLSVESEFQWIVTSPALDAGWTYCGKVDKDQTRYNKAVIRKKDADGKYIDTNNSTNDFEPEAKPSYLN
ncbi:MAG: DUF4876 domain-containing protein [Prevotella sp.]|nr:DUF4876 domain-containing protein [Prevotella sp.]